MFGNNIELDSKFFINTFVQKRIPNLVKINKRTTFILIYVFY